MQQATQSGLAIAGRFTYLHEADRARSLLAAHDIESWILDEHQIRQRWHLGGALGGVKIAVAPRDIEQAHEVLSRDHSADLEDLPEAQLPGHGDELCPRCGATADSEERTQQLPAPLQFLVSVGLLFLGLLVPRRRFTVARACPSCGHTWSSAEHR